MDPVPVSNNRPTPTTTIPKERTLLFQGRAAAFHVTRDMATRGGIRVCLFLFGTAPPPPNARLDFISLAFFVDLEIAHRRVLQLPCSSCYCVDFAALRRKPGMLY